MRTGVATHLSFLVVPSESSWFGLLNGGHVVKLHEQDLYKASGHMHSAMHPSLPTLDSKQLPPIHEYDSEGWSQLQRQPPSAASLVLGACKMFNLHCKEDFIGLRQLDESGRLELKEIDGEHMNFTLECSTLHECGTTEAGNKKCSMVPSSYTRKSGAPVNATHGMAQSRITGPVLFSPENGGRFFVIRRMK
eukprot:354618-Pelagomonas_calceolata.AAC.2